MRLRPLTVSLLLLAAAVVVVPGVGTGAPPSGIVAQPMLGPADVGTVMLGSVTSGGEAGETWAMRSLPLDTPEPEFEGNRLEFGPAPGPGNPDPQLAFSRYTDDDGWQIAETPVDTNGDPWRGVIANPGAARVLARGGGFLVGRDSDKPSGSQATLVARDPGGRFREIPRPGPTVMLPADNPTPGLHEEELADENGLGDIAMTGWENGSNTHVVIAPDGRAATDAILHWDGSAWTREPITIPAGSESHFKVLAMGATSSSNAWFLAETDPALNRGVVLFKRSTSGGAHWEEQDLHDGIFEDEATPSQSITSLRALSGGVEQAITVTTDGIWIDGTFDTGSTENDFTIFFNPDSGADGEVTGSWCDTAACDNPLDLRFSRRAGYRSIAWPGGGFGTRVISNPLRPGSDDKSNRGTWAKFNGTEFKRLPGAAGNSRFSAAFESDDDGWLEGPVRIGHEQRLRRLTSFPISVRSPLTAVATQPGATPGAEGSQALAVGSGGAVLRYAPGAGWVREFLLTSTGAVTSANLRGVAWPESRRAYAVGDAGAMWYWRAETGLWEKDPAAPIGFFKNLLGVGFSSDGNRGYAVGREGTLLRYDKTWTQEPLPAGFASRDLTAISFAGSQALVAAGSDVLINNGSGWTVDPGVHAKLAELSNPKVVTVSGLPDGGAIVAGQNFILKRNTSNSQWQFSRQSLPGATVIAAGAFRAGGELRAVLSVVPVLLYPPAEEIPPLDPNVPTPLLRPTGLPGDGYVLRETNTGWRDEQGAAYGGAGSDRPDKTDPILALAINPGSGDGWGVGGWSGDQDAAGRGTPNRGAGGQADRQRVQTAGVYRYEPGGSTSVPPGAGKSPIPLAGSGVTLAVAGNAQCEVDCSDLSGQNIGPDVMLSSTLNRVSELKARPDGPPLLAYTGGRTPPSERQSHDEADRYASLLGGNSDLPVYPATADGDSAISAATPFKSAFSSFAAPFGQGPEPAGIDSLSGGGSEARTHYALQTTVSGRVVRLIVIDNSRGSLVDSDPHQSPAEAQTPWLVAQLADAKADGIAAIVVGSRSITPQMLPRLNLATDSASMAQILINGGASAYVYDRPEENRLSTVNSGGVSIPAIATGTLGYRSPISQATDRADSQFGEAGFLLLNVGTGQRDPASNRAPVSVRLIPVLDGLSMQAVDGTLLRRSSPSLFQGLGRRPVGGDRWGEPAGGSGNPNPPGSDPYTTFPPLPCSGSGCPTKISPEYTFTSSDPDIADFVRRDPQSSNLRKPYLDPATDKVVTDSSSGLLCPFNEGTTTVRVEAGGLAYTQRITIQSGSVQRPCGTRPLDPSRFTKAAASSPAAPPPPPSSAPASAAPPPPAPPGAVPSQPVTPAAPAAVPAPSPIATSLPAVVPPPAGGVPRPTPPGGATVRVEEEKREEEAAPEASQAFSAYSADESSNSIPNYIPAGALVIAALAAASIARPRSRRGRRKEFAYAHSSRPYDYSDDDFQTRR